MKQTDKLSEMLKSCAVHAAAKYAVLSQDPQWGETIRRIAADPEGGARLKHTLLLWALRLEPGFEDYMFDMLQERADRA